MAFIETKLNLKNYYQIKKVESKVEELNQEIFPRVCDIDIIDFNGQIIQKN